MAQVQGWAGRAKTAGGLDEFRDAVQQTAASNLKADALGDVRGLAIAALGAGAAGRGAVGLYNMFKRNSRPRKRSASASLSMPYPVAAEKTAAPAWLGRLVGRAPQAARRAAPAKIGSGPTGTAGSTVTSPGRAAGGSGGSSGLSPDAQVQKVSPQLHAWMHGGRRTWSGAGLAGLGLGAAGAAKAASFLGGDNQLAKRAAEKQALSPQLVQSVFSKALRRFTGAAHPTGLPVPPRSAVVARKAATGTIGGGETPRVPISGMQNPALVQEGQRLNLFQARTGVAGTVPKNPVYGPYTPNNPRPPADGRPGNPAWYSPAAKTASFLSGDSATSKGGIPWYGPAMMTAGLAGLAGGWKGVDHLLNKRRERDRAKEIDTARQEFHDALMGQYTKPLAGAGPAKTAGDGPPLGAALDALYDQFEKAAFALNDAAGKGVGMYGMYAGLTGLMTGALVYDKARKRQRRAILDKALQRRERRKFNVSPAEITAVPEPFHPEAAAA